jgi:hypothetical protein
MVHCTIISGSAETILFGDVQGGFAEAPTFGETR